MKGNSNSVILLLVLLVVAAVRFLSLPVSASTKVELPIVLILLSLALLVLFLSHEELPWMRNRYLTISYIFLLSFLIVHFQDYIDLVIFPSNYQKMSRYSNNYVTVRAAYISLLGAISYCMGYCLSKGRRSMWQVKGAYWQINYKALGTLSTLFYFVFLVLFIAVGGRTYLSGEYSQETLNNMSGSLTTYSVILMGACFITTTISTVLKLSASNNKISLWQYLSKFSPFFYVGVLIYLFFVISFGDRGPVITYIMTFIGGYFIASKKKINAVTLVVALLVAATTISVWGMIRSDRENEASARERTRELYSNQQTVSPATLELAASNKTTIMAIESTPSQFPYRYGLFTLNNIASIIPFSSSILHFLGIYIPQNLAHSSAFLNWYDHGDRVQAGVGTSSVADIYLDFGVVGVVLVLFLLGMLFRKIDATVFARPISQLSPLLVIAFLVLFSQAVYIPRSVTLFQLRNIVWDYAFLLFFFIFVKKRS